MENLHPLWNDDKADTYKEVQVKNLISSSSQGGIQVNRPENQKEWESPKQPDCRWEHQFLEIKFANPIVFARFTYESAASKQPTEFKLYGGKCSNANKTTLLHFHNHGTETPINQGILLENFCLQVISVTGYHRTKMRKHVVRGQVLMKNFTFWKCKYIR